MPHKTGMPSSHYAWHHKSSFCSWTFKAVIVFNCSVPGSLAGGDCSVTIVVVNYCAVLFLFVCLGYFHCFDTVLFGQKDGKLACKKT